MLLAVRFVVKYLEYTSHLKTCTQKEKKEKSVNTCEN